MSWSKGSRSGIGDGRLDAALRGNAGASASSVVVMARQTAATAPATPTAHNVEPATLAALRDAARTAYAGGSIDEACALQQRVLDSTDGSTETLADDFLFLGLLHYARHDLDSGVAVLRAGLTEFPDNAAMHENLAVFLLAHGKIAETIAACEAALRRGSTSPNLHDCLADAYNRIGRSDAAVAAGRAALTAKDVKFGARAPVATIPPGLPPALNPGNPAENVIAYCLWGNDPRYQVPLLENARIRAHLFPAWTVRVYHDDSVDPAYLRTLAEHGVELRRETLAPGVPGHRRLLWRFHVIADPTVRRFLCRDADSLLSVKERVAVDAWLDSAFWFHTMRDWFTHTDLLLAGMWGGVGNILPPVATLLRHYTAWRVENDHVDQDVLSETVWPTIRSSVLIHDSVFAPCLGSVPFPPFGALPPGMHVGQNAFLHFARRE